MKKKTKNSNEPYKLAWMLRNGRMKTQGIRYLRKKTYFISQKKNRDADEEELQRGLEQSLREVEELGKVSNDRNNSFYHSSYGKFWN